VEGASSRFINVGSMVFIMLYLQLCYLIQFEGMSKGVMRAHVAGQPAKDWLYTDDGLELACVSA
jgi:hypothetical protein